MNRLIYFLLWISIFICVSDTQVKAQVSTDDIVFLKNGSVIHGTILEIIPSQTIKIQTADHNIFVFKMDEVEKISKNYPELFEKKKNNSVSFFSVGYFTGIGNASLDGFTSENEYHALSLRIATGSKINNEFSYGFGIGYERYSGDVNYLPSTEYIPVFLNFRFLFSSKGDALPGLSFDFGYNIGLTTVEYAYDVKFKGGIFLNPSFYLNLKLNPKTSLLFSIGYEFQSHSISDVSSYTSNTSTLESGFLTFKSGIEF